MLISTGQKRENTKSISITYLGIHTYIQTIFNKFIYLLIIVYIQP